MILALVVLAATYAPPPETYSLTKKTDDEIMRLARDGQKLALDVTIPKGAQRAAVHTRTLVDLSTMRAHTWDLNDAKVPCSEQDGKGFDPFDDSWLKEFGEPKRV